jgi:1-acyl-sn-glycerol-3-phosphate acyltransferase
MKTDGMTVRFFIHRNHAGANCPACCKIGDMKYRTLRSITRFIMKFITKIETHDMEKIPSGNVIIAANHLGRLDTAVILCLIDREDIIMAIAEKYQNHPIFGPIGRATDAIWLNRFETDFSALRQILDRMKQGGLFVIAPEGTRSKTEAMQEAKMGAAFLASKSAYPILPVAVTGTEDRGVVENLKRLRRTKSVVRAGELFNIEIPKGAGREEAMREVTDEIMCKIGVMLPEKYRGVYSEHPRLKELLAQQ